MKTVWKNDGCHENGWCVVKKGKYECECKPNYLGDGREKCDGKAVYILLRIYYCYT